MRAQGPFNRKDARGEASRIAAAALAWNVRAPAVLLWTMAAASRLAQGATATWELSYDATLQLLTFEVWSDGRCVYGVDELTVT